MHDSMLIKLERLKERLEEIQNALVDSNTVKDIDKYTQLNKEFSELKPIETCGPTELFLIITPFAIEQGWMILAFTKLIWLNTL